MRHDQRRQRANAGYRLHPGAALPHRALPGRDHHPLRLAHPRVRPALKSVRLANYISTLRHELLELSHACGVAHPGLVGPDRIEILDGHFGSRTAQEIFLGYDPSWA